MLTKIKHISIAMILTTIGILVLYVSVILTYLTTVIASIIIIYIVLQISDKSRSSNSR
jgi:uncharacterized membrane protein